MHILQVLGFPPDRIGGTEVYVAELSRELAALGIGSTLIAPFSEGDRPITQHAGIAVETYPVSASPAAGELRENLPHQGFQAFREILARHPGAIYHQHSWTRGCGAHHLHAARSMGVPTVLTMHVPANLCMRGDMMRFGSDACDGRVDAQECAACWAQSRGLPKPLAQALSKLPLSLSQSAAQGAGRMATALSARALAEQKRAGAGLMIEDCDHIVAVSGWVLDALFFNGAPPQKVTLNRQGVSADFLTQLQSLEPTNPTGKALKLLYLGSWNPLKGVHVAVQAVMSLPPDAPVQFGIHAPTGGPEEQAYEQLVRKIAAGDNRIVFHGPVDRPSLARTMTSYDVLVVPSVWMETGPIVVMEAQAAGLFIVGSDLGGIAENVAEGAGLLVEAGDVAAWTAALGSVLARRNEGNLLKHRRPARSMATVAREMADIYSRLAA
jgi:glycosyltransferase involved in cell wall biosynthesis